MEEPCGGNKGQRCEFVDDMHTGFSVCKNCGKVSGGRLIDPGIEWRQFESEDVERVRTSGRSDDRLASLATAIAPAQKGSAVAEAAAAVPSRRLHREVAGTKRDHELAIAFERICEIAEKLQLTQPARQACKDIASEYAKQWVERREKRSLSAMMREEEIAEGADAEELPKQQYVKLVFRDPLICAIIFVACRREKVPMTLSDIAREMSIDRTAITKAYKNLDRLVPVTPMEVASAGEDRKLLSAENLVARLCEKLGIGGDFNAVEMCKKAAQSLSDGLLSGRRPATIAVGGIYLATRSLPVGATIGVKELANAAAMNRKSLLPVVNMLDDLAPMAVIPTKRQELESTKFSFELAPQ